MLEKGLEQIKVNMSTGGRAPPRHIISNVNLRARGISSMGNPTWSGSFGEGIKLA